VEGKGFVAAKRLARSDLLRHADGRRVAIREITARVGRFRVYNFTVRGTHTYYAAGWWVHNACPPGFITNVGGLDTIRHGGPGHTERIKDAARPWIEEGWPVRIDKATGDGTGYRPDIQVWDPTGTELIYVIEIESHHGLDAGKQVWLDSLGVPWARG
jgi:hypothetical protein